MYVKMKYVLTCSKQLRRQKWWHCPWSKFLVVLHQMSPFSNLSQWSDPCKEQWRKFQVQQVLLTWLGQVGKWLLFHILGPYWCKRIAKMGTSVQWELPTMEQSYLICCQLKWRKWKTQISSKLWQRIGYGKTYLHINHHYLFFTCYLSIAVL